MKRPSVIWVWLVFLCPEFLHRFLPVIVFEKVERRVFDGLTEREWVTKEVDEMLAANERNAKRRA